MKTIKITVKNKIATAPEDAFIVCGNSDIEASFVFDDEWAEVGTKTAVFVTSDGCAFYVPLEEDGCLVPPFYGTAYVKIGVKASTVCTSTAATVVCKPAVTDEAAGDGVMSQSEYDALCLLLEKRMPAGGQAGLALIKGSDGDHDVCWGVPELSHIYCTKDDVYTKHEVKDLILGRAVRRNLIQNANGVVQLEDAFDYLLKDVSDITFNCPIPEASDAHIMLTTAAEGDVSVSFTGITGYMGPDPAEAGNGETWEFDVLYGKCIGRKWD